MLRNGFIIQSQESIYKMIYVLEDDNSIREFVVYTLCHMDLEAKGFERPSEFWAGMEETLPSLILLDIIMPVMDGYQATRHIRQLADSAKATIPIIAVTANAFEEDRAKAMEVGMNAHISKPIDMQALVQIFQKLL